MKPSTPRSDDIMKDTLAPEALSVKNLTPVEIRTAENLVERVLWPGPIPYSPMERVALAILAVHFSYQQRARGKKSKGAAKAMAEYRQGHVNVLLRYVVEKRYRDDPTSLKTVMKIVDLLDGIGIEASDPQVRRDIHAALKLGPLPTR